ncbi:metal ABC transporter permease [Candidatus Saccharibacteria bacterium]|nr:metal ABC transporter permease [Candidatus Saccharibacteria bacterium]
MPDLSEAFSYAFMQRAALAGVFLSICAALTGVTLVLRKSSMIGDGLSHAAFGAFALALSLGFTPIWFALPVVVAASFVILHLSRPSASKASLGLSGDTAIAILSSASLAIGIFALSLSGGVNVDLNGYLFGSILSVSWSDVIISLILAVLVILFYIFAHNRIFAITFDEDFARSIGVKTWIYDTIFAIICSIVVVVGMRLLGSLLISSLIIFPTLIAMRMSRSFKGVVVLAVIVSVVNFLLGLVISYLCSTPTGATVVIVNLAVLILARILRRLLAR